MDKSFAIRDLRYVINQDPTTVVFKDHSVSALVGRLDSKTMAAAAGMQALYQTSAQTVGQDWIETTDGVTVDHTPKVESLVTVGAIEMRVLAVVPDSLRVGVRLDLGAKYQ